MKTLAMSCALLLCCSSTYGQEVSQGTNDHQEPATDARAVLSKPGATRADDEDLGGLDVLFQFVGRWEVDEQYPKTDDDPETTGEGKASYKKALDNTHVIGDYKSRCKDRGFDVEGHAVFVYDEATSTYLYWWFDNYGARSFFEGEYDAGRRLLEFSREDPGGDGGSIKYTHTFHFRPDGSIKLTMKIDTGNNRPETVLTSTLYKKGHRPGEEEEEDQSQAPKKPKVMRGI